MSILRINLQPRVSSQQPGFLGVCFQICLPQAGRAETALTKGTRLPFTIRRENGDKEVPDFPSAQGRFPGQRLLHLGSCSL